MFSVIIFTLIASKMMPKNLRENIMPPSPSNFWILPVLLITRNTHAMLMASPMKMFTSSYIAFNEISVVNTPAPAMSGNTIGTIVAPLLGVLFLKISTSRIISSAIRNIKNL